MKPLWMILIVFLVLVSVCESAEVLKAGKLVPILAAPENPGIVMAPKNISFTDLDWTNAHKRIYLTLDNERGYLINKAIIKMYLPDGWEYIPDINSTRFSYYPGSSTYEITNISAKNIVEWFEIKPGPNVNPGTYYLAAEARINYTNCGNFITINYINGHADYKNSTTSFSCFTNQVTRNDSATLVVAKTFKWTDLITANFPTIVVALCAVITVLFGQNLSERFKRRKETRQNEEIKKKGWWRFWR
jgi:hypothetical protein